MIALRLKFSYLLVLAIFFLITLNFQSMVFGASDLPQSDTQINNGKSAKDAYPPDAYEPDDTFSTANPIIINSSMPQTHNFSHQGDQDWVKFYGMKGTTYNIRVTNTGQNCDAVIDFYERDGVTLIQHIDQYDKGHDENFYITIPNDGVYYVRITNYDPNVYGAGTYYDLSVNLPTAPLSFTLIDGFITDSLTGAAISNAVVKGGDYFYDSNSAISGSNGAYELVLHEGTFILTFTANGYETYTQSINVPSNGEVILDVKLTPSIAPSPTPTPSTGVDKAIILAGSGPYASNFVWDDTKFVADIAWHTLSYQGFTKNTIYYLSFVPSIEPDGNGYYYNAINASPSNANLQYAITTWAQGAKDVVIYITGHGGDGKFQMSGMGAGEYLNASDLSTWLNTLQPAITGKIIFVYDACYSGSFIHQLIPPSGKTRINITSTSSTEEALFVTGDVSFSSFFWQNVFNGANLYDSFTLAANSINQTSYNKQNAVIDDDGDGNGNEKTDGNVAQNIHIGPGNHYAGDLPIIGSVSPAQNLNGNTTATISANVTTTGAIHRVWAIVIPPNFISVPGQEITNLPTFELTRIGGNAYSGSYSNFTVNGTYNITVFALDDKNAMSLPKTTSVTQSKGSATDPQPTIMANGATGTVNLKTSDSLKLTISLNPGSHTNENADWWLYADTTAGPYYFDAKGCNGWTPGYAVAYQGALLNLPSTEVLSIKGLPSGAYSMYFGVDLTVDGKLTNPSYIGSVTINVSE